MFLAIRDGIIVEWGPNLEPLLNLDQTTHEVIEWNKPLRFHPLNPDDPLIDEPMLDPRTQAHKTDDAKIRYRRKRLKAMPDVRECLAMIYRDMKHGTTEYVDTIDAIHAQFPNTE